MGWPLWTMGSCLWSKILRQSDGKCCELPCPSLTWQPFANLKALSIVAIQPSLFFMVSYHTVNEPGSSCPNTQQTKMPSWSLRDTHIQMSWWLLHGWLQPWPHCQSSSVKDYCPICCQILPGSSPGRRLVKWLIGGESLVYVSLMSESDLLNGLRMGGLVSFSSPPGLEGDNYLCLLKIQLCFRWASSEMQGRSQQTNFSSN